MKYFVFLFLMLLVGLGIGGYVFLSRRTPAAPKTTQYKTFTFIGVVQKVFDSNVDYTHLLKTDKDVVPMSSYSLKLDDYIGKTVAVTGEYSGTTLYVDTIVVKTQ